MTKSKEEDLAQEIFDLALGGLPEATERARVKGRCPDCESDETSLLYLLFDPDKSLDILSIKGAKFSTFCNCEICGCVWTEYVYDVKEEDITWLTRGIAKALRATND